MHDKRFTLRLLAAMATLTAPLAFAQGASGPMGGASGPMMGRGGMGGHSQQMHDAMMGGMQKMQGMSMSGDTDKDFAMMMRMHHQQGLEMARLQAQHGKDKQMRAMAQKIMKEQQKEIAEFDRWLGKHK
jgi:uncharacterized protein (DUF305 family)